MKISEMASEEQRRQLVTGLRRLATFLEDNPQLDNPSDSYGLNMTSWFSNKEEFLNTIRQLKKAPVGVKDFGGPNVAVVYEFSAAVKYYICTSRENICIKKVNGTRAVPAITYPSHIEEIVEWECNESILEDTK